MKDSNYSERIANSINKFFKLNDWHFNFDQEEGRFSYVIHTDCKLQSIRSVIHVHDDFFLVYAYCPIKVDIRDKDIMTAVSEFICRANYGMVNGNFELDFRDGEIRYKSLVNCENNVIPSEEQLGYNIFCPCARLEKYSDGLLGVMFGGIPAKDAVEKCEMQQLQRLLETLSDEDSDNNSDTLISGADTEEADGSSADGDINFNLFEEGGNEE